MVHRANQGWPEYKAAGFMGQSRVARSVPSDQKGQRSDFKVADALLKDWRRIATR